MAKRNTVHRDSCPFELSMDLLSGKWKGMILFLLKDNNLRYSAIKHQIPSISDRMLTLSLKELIEDKLIILDGSLTIKHYSLSPLGKDLIPAFNKVREWGIKFKASLLIS